MTSPEDIARAFLAREEQGGDHESDDLIDLGRELANAVLQGDGIEAGTHCSECGLHVQDDGHLPDCSRRDSVSCRHCGVEGEDTGGACPRCGRNRDTGHVVSMTGDSTYTGFAISVPGVDQIEVVSVYCEDPDEQARANQIAHRLAHRIHTLLS